MFRILRKTPIQALPQQLSSQEVVRMSKQACDDFYRQFPKTKSPSYYLEKANQYIDMGISAAKKPESKVPNFINRIELIMKAFSKYDKRLTSLRTDWLKTFYLNKMSSNPRYYDRYINRVRKLVKRLKVANCGEKADIIQKELFDRGIKTDTVVLKFNQPRTYYKNPVESAFQFLVFGLDNKANINDLSTWGENAIIINPHTNFVGKASDGIEKLKQFTRFDESTGKCTFSLFRKIH